MQTSALIFPQAVNPWPNSFGIFDILAPGYVRNIDAEIRKEVLPFLKKFESLSREIQTECVRTANTLSLIAYYDGLVEAWHAHNLLAIKIDPFLCAHCDIEGFEVDCSNVAAVRQLLAAAFSTEHTKRVFSAGVKHALDRWIAWLQIQCSLSSDEMAKVLTIAVPNYYVLSHARHVCCQYAKSISNRANELEQNLRYDFHANSRFVMEGRLSKAGLAHMHPRQLSRIVRRYREMEARLEDIAFEGEYIAHGNSHLRILRLLLAYDNYVEYSFSENLFGIPDLLLRKFTIMSLIRQERLEKRAAILHYSDVELMEALNSYAI